jgi:phi13 family phage major tail protein
MPLATYRQAPASGLSSLKYAIATQVTGAITYGTPKDLVGARALERNPNAAIGTFYSDNAASWQYANNGDQEISLELDAADMQTRAELLGLALDAASGVMSETGAENPPNIAFGYVKGSLTDGQEEYVWLLWGKFVEDTESAAAEEGGRNPQGYKLKGMFGRQPITGGQKRRVYNTGLGVTATASAFFTANFLNGTEA